VSTSSTLPGRQWWAAALTLAERAAAVDRSDGGPAGAAPPAATTGTPVTGTPASGTPASAATARLGRWRAQRPFADPALWTARLAAAGLADEHEAARAIDAVPATPTPRWARIATNAASTPTADDASHSATLVRLATPFADDAAQRLTRHARALAASAPVPFDPDSVAVLFAHALVPTLGARLLRTAILELHVARLRGELQGSTPDARFASYCAALCDPARRAALFAEYPVLARTLAEGADDWTQANSEFLTHLATDRPAVERALGVTLDALVAVDSGAGDRHRGGRSVLVATFASAHEWSTSRAPSAWTRASPSSSRTSTRSACTRPSAPPPHSTAAPTAGASSWATPPATTPRASPATTNGSARRWPSSTPCTPPTPTSRT
jgi:hypothetical protein